MPDVDRVVIGANEARKSAVLHRDSPNHQEVPNIFRRSTRWATAELPVDNAIPGDRGADVTAREPEGSGLTFRALEIPPDIADAQEHIKILQDLNRKVKQKYPPTEADLADGEEDILATDEREPSCLLCPISSTPTRTGFAPSRTLRNVTSLATR